MLRLAPATLSHLLAGCTAGWLLAGCGAPPTDRAPAFGGGASLVGPAPVPAEGAPTESEWRRRLATDDDPTPAALALVALLDREERLLEALVVLDTAARRRPTGLPLRVARAGVLRDLGRRGEALRDLGAAIEAATEPVRAGLLFEWAELAALEGEPDQARRALAQLDASAEAKAFCRERQPEVDALRRSLAEGRRIVPVRVRDLLGDLRGSADAERRMLMFSVLHSLGGDIAARATAVILDDPDPRLRSRGVAAAEVDADRLGSLCAGALLDPAPEVRIAGASRTVDLPPAEAVALLLPTLQAETEPDVFSALDATLARVIGSRVAMPAGVPADPAAREAAVAQWRRQWEK